MATIPHNPVDCALFSCQPELIRLFETLIHVIFSAKDANGVYIEVNSAFVRRTGRSAKGDVIGTTAADHFVPELAERYREQDDVVMGTNQPLFDELELIRRPNGEHGWYLTTKLPVAGSNTTETSRPVGLVSVSRDLIAPSDSDRGVPELHGVVEFVKAEFGTQIRVAELAQVAGCNEAQLERRMKRVFGVTASQHVLRVRVEAATQLLSETDRSLADIATSCGFYDQPDFTRRFARLTNYTPAQFRNATKTD